jgi:hypothetical protein
MHATAHSKVTLERGGVKFVVLKKQLIDTCSGTKVVAYFWATAL